MKGPGASIVSLLDHVQDSDPDIFNAFPLRPSSAGRCTRELAYSTASYMGLQTYEFEDKPARVKRLLNLGHSIEYHVIKHLYKISDAEPGFRIKYKQQALPLFMLDPVGDEPAPEIEGALDLAIELHKDLGFADIKSYGEKWSSWFKNKTMELHDKFDQYCEKIDEKGWWIEDLPAFLAQMNDPFLADNFYQMNAYCHSEFALKKGVSWGSIIKYNKNDSDMWELRFKPSLAMYEEVKAKFQTAYNAGAVGTPEQAPRDYKLGSVRCAFCDYKAYCWPEKDALKSWFETWPKKKWPRDLDRLPAPELVGLFEKYEDATAAGTQAEPAEAEIVRILTELKEKKVKLPNGHIYELKALKTGGVAGSPRIALRRSKL